MLRRFAKWFRLRLPIRSRPGPPMVTWPGIFLVPFQPIAGPDGTQHLHFVYDGERWIQEGTDKPMLDVLNRDR
jgi:hypothetical protein